MKFNININQQAATEMGDVDLVDCAIIDWLRDMCASQHPLIVKQRVDGHTWVSYTHLMADMPLLGFTTKSSVQRRIAKLIDLQYFSCIKVRQKMLVKPLEKLDKLYANRSSDATVYKKPLHTRNATVALEQQNRSFSATNNNTNNHNTKIHESLNEKKTKGNGYEKFQEARKRLYRVKA